MTIQRILLNESERIAYTAKLFGDHFPFRIEPAIFNMAGMLSKDYTGGYWKFLRLSNGAFLMIPDSDKPFKISCMNGYTGTMSADAFGITVCLYAYSNLSFSDDPAFSEICAEQFHLLRDYMLEHQEIRQISAAID